MFPTALIYSSHNRCLLIHRWWLVERALKSQDNKTLLYLPMSMGEMHQQEYSWGTFRWYLDQFRKWGLEPRNFYWREQLKREDLELLFDWLYHSEVVILGGGNSWMGMQRYKELAQQYSGNENFFGDLLRKRQQEGKLTAGFSAGADQLCSVMGGLADTEVDDIGGFGLAHNITTTLHHEWGREKEVKKLARYFPHFMVFALPNDSGLALDQGFLPSGNLWQEIECIVDTTWDIPQDSWHIKTRNGMNIEHFYKDGRNWTFHQGDKIVRVISSNLKDYDAWIIPAQGGSVLHYWSQNPTSYRSAQEIFRDH